MKRCSKCDTTKPRTEFRSRKGATDGLQSWCRLCQNAKALECANRRYKEDAEHRKERAERDTARYHQKMATDPAWVASELERKREYASRPEAKEKLKVRSVAWAKANPEKVAENRQRWVEENRERVRASWRKYYQTDKGRQLHRLAESKRRARLRGAECTLTKEQWVRIMEVWGGECAYCQTKVNITVDHVVPIVKGGPHTPENVVPACLSCNSKKNKRTLEKFINDEAKTEEFKTRHAAKVTELAIP